MSPLQIAADHLIKVDPVLTPVIASSGLPSLEAHTNYYQELVESIIGQQLSVKAAATIRARFVDSFGDQFPTPEQILSRDIEQLRAVGLSRPKAGYIQDLARRVNEGSLRLDQKDQLSNDEIVTELTAVKGIGVWTVHMFLMFWMGRLDVLPIGVLGIRSGIQKLFELDHLPLPAEVTAIALQNNWHPYESVASWYVWQALDTKPINS
jgi:DNA-3-methyladenine glycosylase II